MIIYVHLTNRKLKFLKKGKLSTNKVWQKNKKKRGNFFSNLGMDPVSSVPNGNHIGGIDHKKKPDPAQDKFFVVKELFNVFSTVDA